MPGIAPTAKVLLKARPTEQQLADRLSPPIPAGLELYLEAEDIADEEKLARLAKQLERVRPLPDFIYLVEGPVRSLDGTFFDLSSNTEANRECLRRVADLAAAIGAEAILVHAIAPGAMDQPLSTATRHTKLVESLPLVSYYVELAAARRLVPLLENIPPVARQREGSYMCTPIGMSSRDLVYFAERFPGLGVALDVSHAQLFLNALTMGPSSAIPELSPLLSYLSTFDDTPSMEEYVNTVEPFLFEAHISNATGLMGEGLPYGQGDLDLDALAVRLSSSARYLVTETIEPNPEKAINMRDAQHRLETALSRCSDHTFQDGIPAQSRKERR